MLTASTYIKAKGLPSLQYVSEQSGTSRSTLNGWWHTDRIKFETVVNGCLYRMNSQHSVTLHINGISLDIDAESIKRAFERQTT
jgi:hypothetical protein